MLIDSRRVINHTFELFVAKKKIRAVQTTAERFVARSTRVAKIGGPGDHGISTDSCHEVDRLVKSKAALCRGPAELSTENGFERFLISNWMEVRKL